MFKNFLQLLDRRSRWQFGALVALSIVTSILQTFGVAAVSAFFTLLLKGDLPPLVTKSFGVLDLKQFGILVILAIVVGSISSSFAVYFGQKIAWIQYPRISTKLLEQFLGNNYEWHLDQSASDLASRAITDVERVVEQGMQQVSLIVARGAEVLLIGCLLLYIQPTVAVVTITLLSSIYVFLYILKKRFFVQFSHEISTGNRLRHRYSSEALASIKTVKVSGLAPFFVPRFKEATTLFSEGMRKVRSLSALPRYLLELLVLGGAISFVVLSDSKGIQSSDSVALLALYCAAAIKILPAAQQLFSSAAQITACKASLARVVDGLVDRSTREGESQNLESGQALILELDRVQYQFPAASDPTLRDISLRVSKGEKIGIVGTTGAGKTTLIDVILGLLPPTSGEVTRSPNLRVSYVPQELHFIDDTIAANIALGSKQDLARVKDAAKQAEISDFIETLDQGYETDMKDKGLRLSGGQRQRVGLARALYSKPDLLILDEASNALDAITERRFVNSLLESELTLISISHRLSVLKNCDRLVWMEDGQIRDQGCFQDLLESNETFRAMARADQGYLGESSSASPEASEE